MKKDRAIILTTHSMAESEHLADRIAIMVNGRITCLGTSLDLKHRFGEGYRINLKVSESQIETVKRTMADKYDLDLTDENSSALRYSVKDEHKLEDLLENIESGLIEGIGQWSLSYTSLEDVFLRITRNEKANAQTIRAMEEKLWNVQSQYRALSRSIQTVPQDEEEDLTEE
jgi:ATP-binding cassette subfamily A (ABC1) protein 3